MAGETGTPDPAAKKKKEGTPDRRSKAPQLLGVRVPTRTDGVVVIRSKGTGWGGLKADRLQPRSQGLSSYLPWRNERPWVWGWTICTAAIPKNARERGQLSMPRRPFLTGAISCLFRIWSILVAIMVSFFPLFVVHTWHLRLLHFIYRVFDWFLSFYGLLPVCSSLGSPHQMYWLKYLRFLIFLFSFAFSWIQQPLRLDVKVSVIFQLLAVWILLHVVYSNLFFFKVHFRFDLCTVYSVCRLKLICVCLELCMYRSILEGREVLNFLVCW